MKKIVFLTLSILLLTSLIAQARPVVVLTTDFSLNNEAVGICHGVILSINSDIQIVDLCNNVTPYDINQAGLMLERTTCFPKGTVFVTVVDPGVGTTRNSIAIETRKGLYYIAPNNGLLTYVIKSQDIEKVYELEAKKINPEWKKGTFDGRDLYSPAGAILASSGGKLDLIGKPMKKEDITLLSTTGAKVYKTQGEIIGTYTKEDKPYGNVWTNIVEKDLQSINIQLGDKLHISFENQEMDVLFVMAFGDVPEGKPLAYIGSDGTLAFAINQGSFADTYKLKEGAQIKVKKVK